MTERVNYPIDAVANAIADDMRERLSVAKAEPEPVAWITQHGDLFCAVCVQPTLAQREDWLGIEPGSAGKPDACDLCDRLVTP